MHNHDWSLISFTLLSQLSVGIIVFLAILYFNNSQQFQGLQSGGVFRSPQFIAILAIAIATFISFFHLGHPAHAFHAANNLGSSWLSREILGIGMFGVGVLLIFILSVLKLQNRYVETVMMIYGVISGLVLVYFMSRIYLIPTIPAWYSWFTPFHFFMSAFILGGFAVGGYLVARQESVDFVIWLFRTVSIMLMLQLLAAFLYKNHLVKMEHSGIAPPDFQTGIYHTLYLVRLFVIFVAMFFTIYLSLKLNSLTENYNATIRFYAFVFFLIATQEVIGRFMFYAGYYRTGV